MIGIITQARMTSTRLPGKVLANIGGRPLLEYHLERLLPSGWPVIVATTINSTDDPIIELCDRLGVSWFRGSEDNVLSRYYLAAKEYNLKTIVRVTSDCPLIDGELIVNSYEAHQGQFNEQSYLSNCLQRSYARGFDFEIFSFKSLEIMAKSSRETFEKEHVTPYIWRSHPEKFNFIHVLDQEDNSKLRITVDTKEDFQLVKALILKYQAQNKSFQGITKILKTYPELVDINKNILQKKV